MPPHQDVTIQCHDCEQFHLIINFNGRCPNCGEAMIISGENFNHYRIIFNDALLRLCDFTNRGFESGVELEDINLNIFGL